MTASAPGAVRVVCCQLSPRVGDGPGNVERADRAVADARARGADVIVLPELATSGYSFTSMDEARAAAITPHDPVFRRLRATAAGAVLVVGFAESGDDGEVYNSAVLLDGDAAPVRYRKTHLWDTEKQFFTPGDDPAPVVDTRVGRIAMMICYDMEFPEMVRSVAMRGAQLLTVPANWPRVHRPDGLPAPEVVIAMAAARVNRLPIACCDRAGDDRDSAWNEDTTVIDVEGWPVAVAGPDAVAVADLDLGASDDKRVSARNDLLADRRPDVYRRDVRAGAES